MKYKSILVFLFLSILLFPQSKQTVFYAHINGEIDLGKAPFVRRVISTAEEAHASAIVFEINTFGGRVDAATQIKDAILESGVPTVAFINKRAVSAGALISLACRTIIMSPGSIIGASTVVDQEGKKQSEKYQSYMRSEMRSTAEKNGRRGDLAEAMVDERVVIPGIDDSTKLLSLTYQEAESFGMCDTVLDKRDEILNFLSLPNAEVVEVESNWAESLVAFLNTPFISSLLIIIGMIGVYSELKAPGLGFPGVAGLIAFTLFFGSSYILQIASSLNIILFIVGLILLILEIFVIPGFGITGITGIALIIGSIFFSLFKIGPVFDHHAFQIAILQMAGALVVSVTVISLLVRYLPKSDRFLKLALHDNVSASDGFTASTDFTSIVGKSGETVTPLRPAGKVLVDGKVYDVVTGGGFVEAKRTIKILSADGNKIVVTEV
jgi:membrane-bound serine protease (ClpP class)